MPPTVTTFIHGAIMMAFAIAGVLFLRYFRRSRDRFFLLFALAFWIMASNRIAMLLYGPTPREEDRALLYSIRLAAFLTLLAAIALKNLPPKRPRA
jgi:hypothetical protein